MKNISDVDKNFEIETSIEKSDIKFFDIKEKPFSVHGLFYENGKFRRMAEAVAQKTNDGVCALHSNTAGGRVRFRTDSPYVAIHAEMPSVGKMPHFALTGSAGFDLYVKEEKETYFKSLKKQLCGRLRSIFLCTATFQIFTWVSARARFSLRRRAISMKSP